MPSSSTLPLLYMYKNLKFFFNFFLDRSIPEGREHNYYYTIKMIIFRSFDLNHHNQLTYEEVLSGVAAMDPSTPHGGPSGEMRCRYIFKFYATEQEAVLSFEEFKWVVAV